MKKLFYIGLVGLLIFEFLKVYFIMPLPGSQTMDSIDVAYFLHHYRWVFRITFFSLFVVGANKIFANGVRWIPIIVFILLSSIIYILNFIMTADKMFLQPENIVLKTRLENKIAEDRLIIGVEKNGEAKAYPIEFLTYHHQVQDSVGGMPILVTYCSVCRTGRVYSPIVNGHFEKFRLVGMDHFNAMFEDQSTGSWWRQSTGEAITGTMKGEILKEIESMQMTISKWYELHPNGLVMQADKSSLDQYDSLAKFERGKSTGNLTRTDSESWKDKSWVVGVQIGEVSKAYDWNELKKHHIINDYVGLKNIVIALSDDEHSFVAYESPSNMNFIIKRDTLFSGDAIYNFSGSELGGTGIKLKPISAHQEFWHSWRTFHPNTIK